MTLSSLRDQRGASRPGCGLMLIIIGFGSLLLPLLGIQFRIFNLIDSSINIPSWIISVAFVILGVIVAAIGNIAQDQRSYSRSRADHDREMTIEPTNAAGFARRGLIWATDYRDYDRAIADYDRAIELGSGSIQTDAFFFRGRSYAHKGDYDRAIADYSRAIIDHDQAPDLYWSRAKASALALRGEAYTKKGDYDQAIADYIRAIDLNPDDPFHYYYQLAHLYALSGNTPVALVWLERALVLESGPPYMRMAALRGDDFVAIRDTPAFAALVAKYGEPENTK